jgi:hypothetical protein
MPRMLSASGVVAAPLSETEPRYDQALASRSREGSIITFLRFLGSRWSPDQDRATVDQQIPHLGI